MNGMSGINGMGWGMGFGWLLVLVVVVGVIWFINRAVQPNQQFQNQKTAIDILNERYAHGEIEKEEYLRLKNDIL